MWPLVTRLFFVDCLTKRLSFCYHTVNKDQRYQDSSQPQWQRLSHPALSTWREAFLTLHLECSYMNITAIWASWMVSNDATFIVLIFWWDWSSKRGWSKFYLRWCHNVTERTSIVPLSQSSKRQNQNQNGRRLTVHVYHNQPPTTHSKDVMVQNLPVTSNKNEVMRAISPFLDN